MPQECVCVGGGGGGLRFSYIYVDWDHFGGFKILNFNIFGGVQKYHYFGGYEDFVDILSVNEKLPVSKFRYFGKYIMQLFGYCYVHVSGQRQADLER